MRTAARIDDNQRQIVKALRKIPGVTVAVNHDDILVGYKGRTYWFEVKRPENVSKTTGQVRESRIKPSQRHLLDTWQGHYQVIWGLGQILGEIGIEYGA